MSFYVDEFVTPETLAPYISARRAAYDSKAVAFMKDVFPATVQHLNDGQIKDFVRLAFENAKAIGVESERLHLKFLIPCSFFGVVLCTTMSSSRNHFALCKMGTD